MQKIMNSSSLMEEFDTKMLECSCDSQFIPYVPDRYFLRSFSGEQEDLLNETPRVSNYNPSLHLNLERRLRNQNSLCSQETRSGYSPTRSTVSNETSSPKTVTELAKEITTLELEIVNLEQYLLSLYRTAFHFFLKDNSNVSSEYSRHSLGGMLTRKNANQMENHEKYGFQSDSSHRQTNCSLKCTGKEGAFELWHKENSPALHIQCDSYNIASCVHGHNAQKDIPEVDADHLFDIDQFNDTNLDPASLAPCKLSEDIVRCIAAIYCKLANMPEPQRDKVVFHASSLSFSSTISQQSSAENWSSQSQHEATVSPSLVELQKIEDALYCDMIEIPRISVDGERFGYASKMLGIFRILIKQLKSIDPTKMTYKEQIAFWLNIHNALVMHAFLAYGPHQGSMKSKSTILKAAYNVGGHSINAYVIQSSILGCQPHFSASWLQVLLSPVFKFMKRKQKHLYALEHPQPLAYFAMSQGAFSDPPVRVYAAKNILQELALARKDFIQANIKVQNKSIIILPKILCYYMKDCAFETSKLVKMVIECMPEAEQSVIRECLKGRSDECIVWSKYNSSFRYIIHRDLSRQ